MKILPALSASLVAGLLCSCVSSRTVGYADGAVTTSTVSYSFTGPPLLEANSGRSYHVRVQGQDGPQTRTLKSLEANGLRRVDEPERAFLSVAVDLADSVQGEPGAMKIGDEYLPAFEVKVPYRIVMSRPNGEVLAQQGGKHTEFLTFGGKQRFPTREQAVAALDFAQKVGQDKIEAKAREGTLPRAMKDADRLAASLFVQRNISMDVPVVRSAAGLEFEQAFETLSKAEGPAEIAAALRHYERAGLQQTKADGSPNNTANYGVACGIAACQLMLGRLSESWETATVARSFQPDGKEIDEIRRVIYEQETITGVSVIPEDERAAIDSQLAEARKFAEILGKLAN